MQVNFYGMYRLMAGVKTVEYDTPSNNTLLDLLQVAAGHYPFLRQEIFDERGDLFPNIPLFINGRNPRLLEAGIHTIIHPNDVLSIFSPISSGRINVEHINASMKI